MRTMVLFDSFLFFFLHLFLYPVGLVFLINNIITVNLIWDRIKIILYRRVILEQLHTTVLVRSTVVEVQYLSR